jgi:hypothetical protein
MSFKNNQCPWVRDGTEAKARAFDTVKPTLAEFIWNSYITLRSIIPLRGQNTPI